MVTNTSSFFLTLNSQCGLENKDHPCFFLMALLYFDQAWPCHFSGSFVSHFQANIKRLDGSLFSLLLFQMELEHRVTLPHVLSFPLFLKIKDKTHQFT